MHHVRGDGVIYSFLVDAIGMAGVLLSSFYFFRKAVRYRAAPGRVVLSVLWCLTLALLYAGKPFGIQLPLIRPALCAASAIFVLLLTRLKWNTAVSAFLMSFGISYVLYYAAIFPVGIAFGPFIGGDHLTGTLIDFNRPAYVLLYSIALILQLFFAFLIFRIRRFKNGFPFLFERYAVIISLISTGSLLVLITWVDIMSSAEVIVYLGYLLVAGVVIIGAGIFLWTRRAITLSYRLRMAERRIKQLEEELAGEKSRHRQLQKVNDDTLLIHHKIVHRLAALDEEELSGEFDLDIDKIKTNALPSTGIDSLDRLFRYFSRQFMDNDIDFGLEVSGDIPAMTERAVPKGKLETMIGDHLQDALTAVNAGDGSFRGVRAAVGKAGDHYEFSVRDSGIPFEADTMRRLGLERVTTHAGTGGSGIGFMTTFETMREYGASLIISEKPPGGAGFTKSVTIRFDGENRYIIETYRPGDFPPDERYTLRLPSAMLSQA